VKADVGACRCFGRPDGFAGCRFLKPYPIDSRVGGESEHDRRVIAIGLLFVRMLCDSFKPRQQLQAEILVVRHQLNVLRQRAPRRPHLRWADRARRDARRRFGPCDIWIWFGPRRFWRERISDQTVPSFGCHSRRSRQEHRIWSTQSACNTPLARPTGRLRHGRPKSPTTSSAALTDS
jgi:hypothetical protein